MSDLAYRELIRLGTPSPTHGRPTVDTPTVDAAASSLPLSAAGGHPFPTSCRWTGCTRNTSAGALCDVHDSMLDSDGGV